MYWGHLGLGQGELGLGGGAGCRDRWSGKGTHDVGAPDGRDVRFALQRGRSEGCVRGPPNLTH